MTDQRIQAGKATIISFWYLKRAYILRSLIITQRKQEHTPTDHFRGKERGSGQQSTLKGEGRAMVNQTYTRSTAVSEATTEKLAGQGAAYSQAHTHTILN